MDNSIQFQVQDTIRGCQRLPDAALHESATHSATLIDKLWHLWHTFLFCHERHTFVAHSMYEEFQMLMLARGCQMLPEAVRGCQRLLEVTNMQP